MASLVSVSSSESQYEQEPVLQLDSSHVLGTDFSLDYHVVGEARDCGDLHGDYPVAEATLAPVPNDSSTVTPASDNAVFVSCSGTLTYLRPHFIAVRIEKKTQDEKLGICFRRYLTGVFISKISSSSPFARSDLRVGDKVLSVNGVSCRKLTAQKCVDIIKASPCSVALCVQNSNGDPDTVSCMVQQKPDRKAGIRLKGVRGSVLVKDIDSDSPFQSTLLMPEHRIMFINGISCQGMRAQGVADLMADSTKEYLNIVSRPRKEIAMVIAINPHKTLWTRLAVACGLAAGTLSAIQSIS